MPLFIFAFGFVVGRPSRETEENLCMSYCIIYQSMYGISETSYKNRFNVIAQIYKWKSY